MSGGGGWGVKKGLLSLDPERNHFALSDEEEMQRFFRSMNGDNVAPVGSRIQFFSSPELPPRQLTETFTPSVVLGTAGGVLAREDPSSSRDTHILPGHFGALSTHGIFVSSSDSDGRDSQSSMTEDWKLNVPHSRIVADNSRGSSAAMLKLES